MTDTTASAAPPLPLGFGASGVWGERWFDKKKAEALIERAIGLGIRHFDTAGFYQGGEADRRLGEALGRLVTAGAVDRAALTISTKVGKEITEQGRLVRDFGADAIGRALDRHHRLFGGEPPDIVFLHGPNEHELRSGIETLVNHKTSGALRAIGLCSEGNALLDYGTEPLIDAFMGRLNIINAEHAEGFRAFRASGKRVVGIAPLAQGLWRRRLFLPTRPSEAVALLKGAMRQRAALKGAQSASWLRQVPGWSPVDLSLAYVRLTRAVDLALTTTTSLAHLEQSAATASRPIPADIAALIRAHTGGIEEPNRL